MNNNLNNEEEQEEPMTFKPSKSIKQQMNKEYENEKEIISKSSFSNYNTNECEIIIRGLRDGLYEEYENISNQYNNIKQIKNLSNKDEVKILVEQTYKNFKIFKEELINFINKLENDLKIVYDKYFLNSNNFNYSNSFKLENSIIEDAKHLNNLYQNYYNSSSKINYSPLTSSMLKESINNKKEEIEKKIIEYEFITKNYQEKIKNQENKIIDLNNQISYLKKMINDSKILIDELYNKNQLLVSKLIKYKNLSNKN
jgi:hypothetical protein